jgi:hypothetical protein
MNNQAETRIAGRPVKPTNWVRLAALLLVAASLSLLAFISFRDGTNTPSGDRASDLPMALVDLTPIPKSKQTRPASDAIGTFEWFSTSLEAANAGNDAGASSSSSNQKNSRRQWSSLPDERRWGLTITQGRDQEWVARCGNGVGLKVIEQNRTAEMIEMVDAGGLIRWRVYDDRVEKLAANGQWRREIAGSWNGNPAASLRHPVVNVSAPLNLMQLEWRAAIRSGRFSRTDEAGSGAAWTSTGWLTGKDEPDRLEIPLQTGPEYLLELVVMRTAGKPGLMLTLPMPLPSVTLKIDTPVAGGWATGFIPTADVARAPMAATDTSKNPRLVTLRKHRLQCNVTERQVDAWLDDQPLASWKTLRADAASAPSGQAPELSPLVLEFGQGSYEVTEMKLLPRVANRLSSDVNGAPTPPVWASSRPPPTLPEGAQRAGQNPAVANNLIPLQPVAAPRPDSLSVSKNQPQTAQEELPPPSVPYEPTLLTGDLLTQFHGAQQGLVSTNGSEWLLQRVPDHEVKVAFPGCLPRDYVLEVKFRKQDGPDALIVCIPVGSRHAQVMLNAYPEQGVLSGVETEGPLPKASQNPIRGKVLDLQRDYLLRCAVGEDQFEVTLDGESLAQWRGDPKALRVDARSPKIQGQLAIVARQSAYKLLSVRVEPKPSAKAHD